MRVYEYFPAFVDGAATARSAEISKPEEALGVDWLIEKRADRVDEMYVMAGNLVVGLIRDA